MAYTVWAHSPSLNQTLRQINLHDIAGPKNQREAEQAANAFAHIQNTNKHLNATDWQALVKQEELGIQTLPQYQFHTGV